MYLLLGVPVPAAAQAEAPLLWKDLAKGDTPAAVVGKLVALPEIKSAKVKVGSKPNVSIKYRGAGIDVLGHSFLLALTFEGSALDQVALGTEKVCTTDSAAMYRDMMRALSAKYPEFLGPKAEPSQSELSNAFLNGTDENPETVARFLTDGKVVVAYLQRFTAETPLPPMYSTSSAMNALARLLYNQYESRAKECDGTGAHRVQHMLSYMTKEQFEAQMQDVRDQDKRTIEAARVNL